MSNRFPNPENQFFDEAGLPLAGGLLHFYASGSSTPLATYSDSALAIPNTNPVVLDPTGATGNIFLQTLPYKVVLEDSNGSQIWTADPVSLSDYTTNAQFVTYPGDPNGNVAGTAGSTGVDASVIWDRTNNVLYVCTTTGSASTAVWTAVAASFPSAIIFTGTITPTALGGDTNDWAPTGFSGAYTVRATSATAVNLSGLAGGAAGREIILLNAGAANITLLSNSSLSASGNRFVLPRPVVLHPEDAVTLHYDGTSNGWIVKSPSIAQPVASGFKNLVITGTSNTQATCTADSVILEDGNGASYQARTVSLTVDITSGGANGLDTGAEASNTWYFYFVIFNPTMNVLAALLSLSATAPTLPSGYTFFARVGALRNDNASNLLRVLQRGRVTRYVIGTNPTAGISMATGTAGNPATPTWVAIATGNYVPPTAAQIIGYVGGQAGGTSQGYVLAPNNSYGAVSSTTNPPPVSSTFSSNSATGQAINTSFQFLLESTNIYWASSLTAAVYAAGWVDNL